MNSPSLLSEFVGVGMTDKYMPSAERPMWNAWYWTNKASDCLLVQDTLDTHKHGQWRGNERMAIEFLEFAANALGYDMVKRMTAQQANDFALACRLSEDRVPPDSAWQPEDGPPPVTSAPGFDGRAQLVGRDDRDPVGQVLR